MIRWGCSIPIGWSATSSCFSLGIEFWVRYLASSWVSYSLLEPFKHQFVDLGSALKFFALHWWCDESNGVAVRGVRGESAILADSSPSPSLWSQPPAISFKSSSSSASLWKFWLIAWSCLLHRWEISYFEAYSTATCSTWYAHPVASWMTVACNACQCLSKVTVRRWSSPRSEALPLYWLHRHRPSHVKAWHLGLSVQVEVVID